MTIFVCGYQTIKMSSTKLIVAAIDFGTTFSGYAFSFAHDFQSDPFKIQTNHWIGGGHISLKVVF